ncbi:MAG: hypothetical protein M3Z04_22620 [Chloroflexota bacterium]|nr:hypothetical protein [Chloroflexota bacterium]
MVTKIGQSVQDIQANLKPALAELGQGQVSPQQILAFLLGVVQAGKAVAGQVGAKIAESVMSFLQQPDGQLGESLGRVTGNVLFEVALTALTAGGYGVKPLIEKLGRLVVGALEKLEVFLHEVLTWAPKLLGLLHKLAEGIGSGSKKALQAIIQHIESIFVDTQAAVVAVEEDGQAAALAATTKTDGTLAAASHGDNLDPANGAPSGNAPTQGAPGATGPQSVPPGKEPPINDELPDRSGREPALSPAEIAAKRQLLRKAALDERQVDKHLLDTPASNRLLAKEGAIHVFIDRETMNRVIQEIIDHGQYLGSIRGHERWGVQFNEAVGYRMTSAGTKIPLTFGELKVQKGVYHAVPRTRPAGQ